MLINSTNLGLTPLAQALCPAAVAATTQLSAAFNGALAQQVPALKAISPGLTNGTAPCLNVFLQVPTLCPTPDAYFYWDDHHGTQETHRQIAAQVLAAIGR